MPPAHPRLAPSPGQTIHRETVERLVNHGYAFLPAADTAAALEVATGSLEALRHTWSRLPRDNYLRDGGRYRSRRHGCFVQDVLAGALSAVPRRPHWQSTSYNALHGGIERWFEPIEEQ